MEVGGESMANPIVGETSSLIKSNTNTPAKSNSSTLGKDDFLKILITQLKNQDPMQPLQDKDFIAQMAQFTSVEQLTNMATEMKTLSQSLGIASGLIGKEVSWSSSDSTGKQVVKSGVVDSITFNGGIQYANVKGEEISLDKLLKIANAGETK
jgi:flagellar basal-body rod modification protein FlgD